MNAPIVVFVRTTYLYCMPRISHPRPRGARIIFFVQGAIAGTRAATIGPLRRSPSETGVPCRGLGQHLGEQPGLDKRLPRRAKLVIPIDLPGQRQDFGLESRWDGPASARLRMIGVPGDPLDSCRIRGHSVRFVPFGIDFHH